MSQYRSLPPSAGGDFQRQHAETVNRLGAITQPFHVLSVTANTTCSNVYGVYLVDASGGAVTITLPPAGGYKGVRFNVKKVDASGNAVTIDGDGAETIDGSATQSIVVQNVCLTVVSDGSNWWVV